MDFFDALLNVDQEWGVAPRVFSDVDSIRAVMDRYGIARAVVSSFALRRPGVPHVNELIFEAAAQDERLVPAPVVLPDSGLEVGDEDAYVAGLVRRGARAVCFYPQTCGTSLDRRVIGGLFAALERRRVPVALFETGWIPAADLAAQHPDLPVVLHSPDYRNRQVLPIFRDTPNLYVSLAPNFAPYRGLETIVGRCGADRILFASGYPESEPGAAIGYLLYSGLDDESVEKIASGNLQRLVAGVVTEGAAPTGAGAAGVHATGADGRLGGLCAPVWERKPVGLRGIVDMHTHYGQFVKFPVWGGDADDLVAEMDRVGIERILTSHQASMSYAVVEGNDSVLAGMRRYPDRILGYAVCYPVNERIGIAEIVRCVEAGMPGIKMHDASGIPYTAPGYRPVWEFANERRLPVLLHTWGDVDRLAPIFETYRDCPILLGHSGCKNPEMYVDFARRFEQLWLELCFSKAPCGIPEYFVRELGAERVLYGSDAPWMPFGHQISRVLFADIGDDEKTQILVENPKRVLSRAGGRTP